MEVSFIFINNQNEARKKSYGALITCLDDEEEGAASSGTATECLRPWESVFVLVRITSELDGVELYENKKIEPLLIDSKCTMYYANL